MQDSSDEWHVSAVDPPPRLPSWSPWTAPGLAVGQRTTPEVSRTTRCPHVQVSPRASRPLYRPVCVRVFGTRLVDRTGD